MLIKQEQNALGRVGCDELRCFRLDTDVMEDPIRFALSVIYDSSSRVEIKIRMILFEIQLFPYDLMAERIIQKPIVFFCLPKGTGMYQPMLLCIEEQSDSTHQILCEQHIR